MFTKCRNWLCTTESGVRLEVSRIGSWKRNIEMKWGRAWLYWNLQRWFGSHGNNSWSQACNFDDVVTYNSYGSLDHGAIHKPVPGLSIEPKGDLTRGVAVGLVAIPCQRWSKRSVSVEVPDLMLTFCTLLAWLLLYFCLVNIMRVSFEAKPNPHLCREQNLEKRSYNLAMLIDRIQSHHSPPLVTMACMHTSSVIVTCK